MKSLEKEAWEKCGWKVPKSGENSATFEVIIHPLTDDKKFIHKLLCWLFGHKKYYWYNANGVITNITCGRCGNNAR